MSSSVDQINVIISQEPLLGEAELYPVLTVQVILEIPPICRGIPEQAHSCRSPSTSPLNKDRHGPVMEDICQHGCNEFCETWLHVE